MWGLLQHQRRRIVFSASAVLVGGRAVLFCGPSGAGKSTLAVALGQRGYPLVADDICALDFEAADPPRVWPDGGRQQLWSEAIDGLGLARQSPVRSTLQKYYVEPAERVDQPAPMGALYVLRDARPPHAPGIERPNIVDAALLVRGSAYRPRLIDPRGQAGDYFSAAADIGRAAGVFHLTRCLELAQMDEVVGWLLAHWTQLGLLPRAA